MTEIEETPHRPAVTWKIGATALALTAAAAGAVALAFGFVDEQRQRELNAWQTRLGIVADSRTQAISDWVRAQFREIGGLAENQALRLYMTRMIQGADPDGAETLPEAGYLNNLLTVTASRTGFAAPPVGPDVGADVPRRGVAGIALVDMRGRVLVATAHFPPMDRALRTFLKGVGRGERALRDMYIGASGKPTMGFVAPVFAVQGNPVPEDQIGVVVGIKPVAHEVFPLLRQPGAVAKSAESVLVRANGPLIEYLSPLADGTPALAKRLARNTPGLAAAAAVAAPGGFLTLRDYRDVAVLAVSRRVKGTPWTLIRKIDRAEALADAEARLTRLLVFLLLAIALVTAAIVAVWRHGASRRAGEAAARYQEMARRFENQRNFLRLLTDNQPNAIFIVDDQNRYRFANDVAAERAGIGKDDMVGKSLASVLGPNMAKQYARRTQDAIEAETVVSAVHRIEGNGSLRVVQSKHVPLRAMAEVPRGVLVVEEDVTAAVTERERRERILKQLVKALVTVVDCRDPHAAHHSARVAEVARAIAVEMGLDDALVETVEFAGSLMNLGKILVPAEILTKATALTPDEIRQVRQSIQGSADLIEGIEFDGPVAETLRQCQERWDGTGTPRGLAGEEILATARIVSVANAFVAMVSPRAHRPGADVDTAVDEIMSQAGKAYDRRVVAALVNHLDNRGGRARWARPATQPGAS